MCDLGSGVFFVAFFMLFFCGACMVCIWFGCVFMCIRIECGLVFMICRPGVFVLS